MDSWCPQQVRALETVSLFQKIGYNTKAVHFLIAEGLESFCFSTSCIGGCS